MKKNIVVIAFLAIAVLFSNETTAQKFNGLDKSPADIALYKTKADGVIAKVVYSRPQLKGRSLSKLAPQGKVWRLGANEATEIRFYKDVTFGGQSVKAGTYSMFAIPGASAWTLILNKDTNVWGAFSYKESQDVVRVTAQVSKNKNSVEALAIMFSKSGDMYIGWGNTVVTVPVK
ncbi:hypothetical protein KCTC32516_00940 [Polaribacter huanghezhanensis]|uniref:DUF2911 domain-containing protein n=1 Tax=Polaribacter huanghezhanensis TaxID=1354726 RepID=UPI002647DDB5|nr:DUF2911 domain-containing protein [Polaribacter huanghezhanensis]WKD85599.1 hypothetical protein KCTC32516_00940 [Polaribacter huanghezhanensis]